MATVENALQAGVLLGAMRGLFPSYDIIASNVLQCP
jgi:hypothetical protein